MSTPATVMSQPLVQRWWAPVLALAALIATTLIVFAPTFVSMVDTWARSDTFAHGFLVVPIVLFLVYLKRDELAAVSPRPYPLALVPIVLLGLAWVMGELVDVISVRQFAATLMIPFLVWLVMGTAVVRILQFPLAYLLFAVPLGEFLVPPLMDFTAEFTVAAVQLSGIPIYRDGLHFELPTGRWSVVEACSGVRYLIASVALGTLYAYLMYRSLWRRLAFVGVAIIVPIIANGLRAYMIVMIGHLSDMEYAAGADHLLYGWVFFGVVIFLMFWIGALWREDGTEEAPARRPPAPAQQTGAMGFAHMAVIAALVVTLGPVYAHWMDTRDLGPVQGLGTGPVVPSGWTAVPAEERPGWQPGYQFMRAERGGWVVNDSQAAVGMHVGFYREQARHGNMLGWHNTLAGRERAEWSQTRRGQAEVAGYPDPQRVLLRGRQQQMVAWQWYWANGHLTTRPFEVKAREATSRLLGGRDDAALIVVYAEYRDDLQPAEDAMRAYVEAAMPQMLEQLQDVSQR
ncbi:exosortase 1 [Thioalkalivibrio sp. K90mix]|uniref:exosortase A n=1 Tax=Thioalkalivibrio sp. (strain K90mix) TaxID=396595 RepID=UPI0001959F7D|nr:exosortase A [Thioalkalivibrio sp. K90mix]ADC73003.1 exosortase 1 [Thioalkalivibrio sp. K90mix]